MKIHVILAGLKKENAEKVLQRMEALVSSLPAEAVYTVYQAGCEDCLDEIKSWAACRKLTGGEPVGFESSGAEDGTDLILVSGTSEGKELGMMLAAALKKPCRTEVISFHETYSEWMAVRNVYSTHAEGLYPAAGSVCIAAASGEKKEYIPADSREKDGIQIPVHQFELFAGNLIQMDSRKNRLVREVSMEKAEDLSGARLVLLGGKGLGSKANFQRLEDLAKKLGASAGCTRPVAMAGWASYDKVVGLSGSILSADVCIAFGVSGAGPLMEGASGAARLVAVNNDPKAPIFHYAHDGVVADCLEIMAAMEQLTETEKQEV